jgi:serine/threonine-protein kinase RsbW
MLNSTIYSIESNFEAVSHLGQTIHHLAADAGMGEIESARFELGVVEALNNVVEHAYQMQSNHTIKVVCELSKTQFIIHIADKGIAMRQSLFAINSQQDIKETSLVEDFPEGGWGLTLIKSIMDEVSYKSENGTNHLTLLKKMNG